MDVLHTAIWVSDLDATTTFYEDHLGLSQTREFVGDDGAVNYFVAGEGDTEIQFKHDPEGDGEPVDPGDFDHVALAVEDTDAMVEHVVEETAGSLRAGPMDHDGELRIAFVEDPDGYGVELVEER
ncbi:MAG: VOC family protein [Halobacteriaceae archaeon]